MEHLPAAHGRRRRAVHPALSPKSHAGGLICPTSPRRGFHRSTKPIASPRGGQANRGGGVMRRSLVSVAALAAVLWWAPAEAMHVPQDEVRLEFDPSLSDQDIVAE